jgi:hypothetical protein
MNQQEFDRTLAMGIPDFGKRFKFFSPSLEFVVDRVQNSTFAHSHLAPHKYARVVEFTVSEADMAKIRVLNSKELMVDRRVSHQIQWQVRALT